MAVTVASLLAVLDLDKGNFDKNLKSASGRLDTFAKSTSKLLINAGAVAGGAIVGVGTAALNFEKDLDKATAKIATDLGITKDEAMEFEDAMLDVFKNNFGNDFDDIGDAVSTITKKFGRLEKTELKRTTKQIIAVRDAFDKDFNEVADAATVLMEEFGLTSQQSLDFVTKGLQEIPAEDLLDTIREYGNLFGEAGFDAGQFFSLLETGAEGGVLGTDKMADAFKEFQIRFLEGDKKLKGAIAELTGDDWAMFVREIEVGDNTVGNVFKNMIENINSIEDPIARNAMGVALMGTQWEDLGSKSFAALDLQETKMGDIEGATETLNEQYDNLDAAIEGLKRTAISALAPIGQIILDAINDKMPEIQAAVEGVADWLANDGVALFEQFSTGTVAGTEPVLERFAELAETGGGIIDQFGELLGVIDEGNEKWSRMDTLLWSINAALGAVAWSIDFFILQNLKAIETGIANVNDAIDRFGASWAGLGSFLAETSDDIAKHLKVWALGNSPPPLAEGLSMIGREMNNFPSLNNSLGGVLAAGSMGGTSNVTVNVGGVSTTTNTGGDANNEAIRLTLQLLRSQLEQAG